MSNLTDLHDAMVLGLPMAAEWNVSQSASRGYPLQYHIDQVKAGHRFLPSIRLLQSNSPQTHNSADTQANVDLLDEVSAEDWQFLRDNEIPICLRTENIVDAMVGLRRYGEMTLPESPFTWMMKSGVLTRGRRADVLAPVTNWENEGRLWGSSIYVAAMQNKHPTPSFVIFLDNNEGPNDLFPPYCTVNTAVRDVNGVPQFVWRSLADIERISVRMLERVVDLRMTNPDNTGTDFLPEYWTRRRNQYLALFVAFEQQLTAWSGKVYRAAYSSSGESWESSAANLCSLFARNPEWSYYDFGSPSIYATGADGSHYSDFTSPEHLRPLELIRSWELARARNPKLCRELSIRISADGVLAGPRMGLHEAMTPARYQAWCEWVLWSIHDPGVPVILRRWCKSTEVPDMPMFSVDDYPLLELFGAPELRSATSDTYLQPIISAVDHVCEHPVLRDFWLRGVPVIVPGVGYPDDRPENPESPRFGEPDNRWRFLECSLNPPREQWPSNYESAVKISVWCVATKLDGRYLLYCWTPCDLSGTMRVTIPGVPNDVMIPVPQPSGYWLVEPPTGGWLVGRIA